MISNFFLAFVAVHPMGVSTRSPRPRGGGDPTPSIRVEVRGHTHTPRDTPISLPPSRGGGNAPASPPLPPHDASQLLPVAPSPTPADPGEPPRPRDTSGAGSRRRGPALGPSGSFQFSGNPSLTLPRHWAGLGWAGLTQPSWTVSTCPGHLVAQPAPGLSRGP